MTSTRDLFRQAVTEYAAKAKATLPDSNGRIDAAVKLVLAGDVDLLPDGSAMVKSASAAGTEYHLTNGTCDCADFPRAPQGYCKHKIAAAIEQRAADAVRKALDALDVPQDGSTAEDAPAESPLRTRTPRGQP